MDRFRFWVNKVVFYSFEYIKGYITLVVRRLLLKYILSIICFDDSLSCRFSDVMHLGPLKIPSFSLQNTLISPPPFKKSLISP